jgi:hypothetical protein
MKNIIHKIEHSDKIFPHTKSIIYEIITIPNIIQVMNESRKNKINIRNQPWINVSRYICNNVKYNVNSCIKNNILDKDGWRPVFDELYNHINQIVNNE